MQTLMLRPLRASLSLVLFPLAMLASSASLVACSGDDTNPPAPDAGSPSDAASDASKSGDGSVDSSVPADAADSGSAGDAADASG